MEIISERQAANGSPKQNGSTFRTLSCVSLQYKLDFNKIGWKGMKYLTACEWPKLKEIGLGFGVMNAEIARQMLLLRADELATVTIWS